MPRLGIGALATAILLALGSTAWAGGTGHVNFVLGQKQLDAGDWDPVDRQSEFGAVMSFGREGWPVFIAVDILASADDGTLDDDVLGPVDVTAATVEVAAGVRKIWDRHGAYPYVGGGLAAVGAAVELDSDLFPGDPDSDADDSAIGPWVGGGVFWRLGPRFNLGFDVRWTAAKTDLVFDGATGTSSDIEIGGLHYGLSLGFGW